MNNVKEKLNSNVKNAIAYIKSSSIFSNDRYLWIRPLILNIFENSLNNSNIDELIDSLLLRNNKQQKKDIKNQSQAVVKNIDILDSEPEFTIRKICSIDKIINLGLLDINEPIKLKEGLNVLYGKNGAGKSSIYLGLCKVMGKNKRVYSNINNQIDELCCQVTCEDINGNTSELAWNSNQGETQEQKVMIFDSQISNYIIKEDQVNQFKMVHLKMEYFSYLYDLYDKINDKFDSEVSQLNREQQTLNTMLLEKVPFIFEDEFDCNIQNIQEIKFASKENDKLELLESQIKTLNQEDPSPIIKNINNVIEEVKYVLSCFGELEIKYNANREAEYSWKLSYTQEYFKEVNKKHEAFIVVKNDFENSERNKLSLLIPQDWIDNEKWENFINNSIEFLNSLNEDTFNEYTEDKCAYCHQSLQTKAAKTLIKAYQELHKEHKEKLDNASNELNKISKKLEKCVNELNNVEQRNEKIETEFKNINKEEKIEFDFDNLKNIFKNYKNCINKKLKLTICDDDMNLIKSFCDIYKALLDQFNFEINRLNNAIIDKKNTIIKLTNKAEPLRQKRNLCTIKDTVIDYIKNKGEIGILKEKINDLRALKQSTSTLKSSFSQDAALKEFQRHLRDEYKVLGFSPPTDWDIKPSTRKDVNKRVYNIGDRRLADIFSEGEQKLHALSDFFAQCELDKYKGLYIFDDPVNSLDEDNIEVVAERILRLTENGNQVIVFTHNLYFLNSIINTQKDKVTKVERSGNQVILIKDLSIGETQELKDRLKKIDSKLQEFSNKKGQGIDDLDLRNVYDLISGYLEDYVEKVYFKNVISRYRPNIRMQTLQDLKNLDTNIIENISTLYDKASRRCLRHSQPSETRKPNYNDLLNDVKELKEKFNL